MTCTPNDVRAITGSTLSDTAITPFITAANVMITRAAECSGTTDNDEACAFLSAHLMTSSQVGKGSAQIQRESLEGKYSVTYAVSMSQGSGVLSTNFGQTANMLMNGCLAELSKRKPVIFATGMDYDA